MTHGDLNTFYLCYTHKITILGIVSDVPKFGSSNPCFLEVRSYDAQHVPIIY